MQVKEKPAAHPFCLPWQQHPANKNCCQVKAGKEGMCIFPSWGWTSFVWGGSCQIKEHSCAFKIIFGLFHVFLDKGAHRASVPMKSFHLKLQMMASAILSHMFPSMTAHREEMCDELLLTDVANPPAKVKIRGMVLLLRQLQLCAKSLFQQQALNQPWVLETAKQADICKYLFFFFK